jgi:uncharacterized protein
MSWWHAGLLFVAGIGGGLAGSIAGLASLTTYPALLAIGLPPVTANVTNTVALVFNGVGSVLGSRQELAGQGALLRRMLPFTAVGGAAGGALLLFTPAEGFERVVPALLAFASVAILLPRRVTRSAADDGSGPVLRPWHVVALVLVGLYGGYFGAAAGVILLAVLLRMDFDGLAHANAAKNVLLGVANLIAALMFVTLAPVHWLAVAPLGVGCLIGARLGPIVVRRAPATPIRVGIGVAGLALAVKLGLDTY